MTGKRQSELEGFERPSIPEIDSIARRFLDAQNERKQLLERETELKAHLIAVMSDHADSLTATGDGDVVYEFVDGDEVLRCVLRRSDAVKVARVRILASDFA